MPEIQFPTADDARTTLLSRLFIKLDAMAPADRPVSAEVFSELKMAWQTWTPLIAARRAAASGQSGDVSGLHQAQTVATMYVSHYLRVFTLAVQRGVYQASDRALFGLPISSADLPDFRTDAALVTWLTNIASGDAALQAAGRPAMTNPTAAEVAAKGTDFTQLLTTREASGEVKNEAVEKVEAARPGVDEAISDVYADLKHRYRKLAPPAWRDMARTYGFRFTNHRGEHPEGRYEGPVDAGALLEVYEGIFDPALRIRLRNPGLTAWEIGLAPTPGTLPAGRTLRVAAGQEVRCGLPELGNIADRHLLLRNLDGSQTGAWEVEFEAHA